MVIKMNENEKNESPIIQNKSISSFKFLKPNKIVAIVIYCLMIFIVAGFITIGLAMLFSINKGVNIIDVLESLTNPDFVSEDHNILKINAMSQGWGNFFGYLIATLGVVFYMRDDVALDFKDLIGENKKKHFIFIPICTIAFIIITITVESLIGLIPGVSSSANQTTIENIINNGGMVPMILATVLLAPVVEELIYRKAIFSLTKNYGVLTSYILSIAIFTLPHMITSDMSNIGIWLLQCIPYALAGGLLCFIYHKSNYNIYSSIFVHLINNLIACIIVFI